ncbi:virulence factor MviN [Ramlibacter sp. USB13]|uniref:Virulence factor MviN n=1 Tax=Ramlibacter cellulosilyticus TaxID=2764187 RepID=A0A923MVD7_9BURK|nr:lipid II flippase MurJ [Ramlibacter cellulosilyticus]MBC5784879.1 virulence factor MviN [Ramlibacter cellulosilyticus]
MRRTLSLGLLAAANIGLGFVSQWYVLTHLGAGSETDALFAGMTLPQLILSVISGSLVSVLVPLLAGENKQQLHHDAWAMLVLVGATFTAIALVLFATASWWTPLLVPGFSPAAQALTTELTRIQLVGMVFAAINGVQLAAYHARHRFVWPEIGLALSSLAGFAAIVWLLPRFGVAAVAWITVGRMALQTAVLLPGMGRPVRPDLHAPAIRLAWQRVKPLLVGTTYYKTDPLVDRFLLSTAASGSLSLYYLAQQLYAAANEVMDKAIASPLVPRLSTLHKRGQRQEFRRAYHQHLLLVCALSLGGLLVLGVVGRPLLDLVFGWRNITASDVETLWWILLWLGGVFVGGIGGQISAGTFYALGDTRTPTRLGVITYTFYIPAKIAAFFAYGVMGLALMTSLFSLVNLVLQMVLLQRIPVDEPEPYPS